MEAINRSFNGLDLSIIETDDGDFCLSADQAAKVLGYADTNGFLRLMKRNANLITPFKGVVKLTTPGGMQDVTVIAEQGLYLLAMKSGTDTAKDFQVKFSALLKEIRKGRYGLPATGPSNELAQFMMASTQVVQALGTGVIEAKADASNALRLAQEAKDEAGAILPAAMDAMQTERDLVSDLRRDLIKVTEKLVDEALSRGFFGGNRRAAFQSINTDVRDRYGVRDAMGSGRLRLAIAYVGERFDKLTGPNRLDLDPVKPEV